MSKLVKLTDPTGNPVYICPTWVQIVQRPGTQFAKTARTELVLSGYFQCVRETPEEVVKLLEKEGG